MAGERAGIPTSPGRGPALEVVPRPGEDTNVALSQSTIVGDWGYVTGDGDGSVKLTDTQRLLSLSMVAGNPSGTVSVNDHGDIFVPGGMSFEMTFDADVWGALVVFTEVATWLVQYVVESP